MLQLKNKTPFAAATALLADAHGLDTVYTMVRADFTIGPKWTLAKEQPDPLEADVYWGDPETSSIRYASDYHIGKPSSDVVMVGLACAPERQTVRSLDVQLSVGQVSKTIRVFGDRFWQDGRISSPEPFQTMPMVYEKAFGGVHLVNGDVDSAELHNPLGCGFAGSRNSTEMNGVPLPNLEDPANLINRTDDTPVPACFGFSAPAWLPRVNYAGTYDEDWQTQRAPFLPHDFDHRFLNMAHPDLIYPGYLNGGEVVFISGMHPNGDLRFELPLIGLTSEIRMEGRIHRGNFNLETLILEPNLLQLSMVWRSAFPCDKKALAVEEIKVDMKHDSL